MRALTSQEVYFYAESIGMDHQSQFQQPTVIMTAKTSSFFSKINKFFPSEMKLKIFLALIFLLAILFYIIFNVSSIKKTFLLSPTPSPIASPAPLELITQGIVSEINTDSLIVKEKNGLEKQVFIGKQTPVTIQKVSLPSAKGKPASGSATLIGTLASSEKADITKIKNGDEVKVVIETKDSQVWAKRITVTRKIDK